MADADDDDGEAVGNYTTIQIGLPKLLRPAYHQYILPRITEIARNASLVKRYASQLLNVYLQDDTNELPAATADLQTFFNQAQGLFAENWTPRKGKQSSRSRNPHRSHSDTRV